MNTLGGGIINQPMTHTNNYTHHGQCFNRRTRKQLREYTSAHSTELNGCEDKQQRKGVQVAKAWVDHGHSPGGETGQSF